MKLQGKRAVVTGSSHGLGLAIARQLLADGAQVLMCARNAADLSSAHAELEAAYPGRAFAVPCDIAQEAAVETLAACATELLGSVDILICNAGIYGPKGALDTLDWTAWVHALQVNLIGTVYCCRVFLPLLRQATRGKVVIISGGGATKPLPFLSAYSASKAGLVRFAETLAEELKSEGIDVNAVAPGALNTRFLDEVLAVGPEVVGEAFYKTLLKQRDNGGAPLTIGAELCSYLASAESDGVTGKLISAQWDPWRRIAEFQNELMASDIWTLRRIIPAERDKDWDAPS